MMSSERPDDEPGGHRARLIAPAAASLALLDALLDISDDASSCAPLFGAARGVFAFDRAIVLLDEGDALRCVATDPDPAGESRWPCSPALARAARSRVLAFAASEASEERALLPPDLVLPDEPALLIPIAAGGRHGALLLRRAAGAADFAPDLVVSARQCAI